MWTLWKILASRLSKAMVKAWLAGGGQAVVAEREVPGKELQGGPGRLAGALTTRTAASSCSGRRGTGLGGLPGETRPQAEGDQSRPQ